MKILKGVLFAVGIFLLSAHIVAAQIQSPGPSAGIQGLTDTVTGILGSSIIRLLFALAFVYFFWGVIQYTIAQTQESKDKGRGYMIWGLIALTVMFSVYGLIRVVRNTFDIKDTNTSIKAPSLPTQ
ncbi:MAG: hypothetical protein ACK4FA_00680 [Candidatus Paceibacteria bacterium]